MEKREILVRPASPGDGPAFCRLNKAFNGEGVSTPEEAARALACPGPERVLLAFWEGEPRRVFVRAYQALRLLPGALRRGDRASTSARPSAAGAWRGRWWKPFSRAAAGRASGR